LFFRAAGYNIDSLTVARSNPRQSVLSRIDDRDLGNAGDHPEQIKDPQSSRPRSGGAQVFTKPEL